MSQKQILFVICSTMLIALSLEINANSNQIVFASQSYCPPICLNEVNQHVDNARDYLDKGDIVKAKSELDIVNSLLDQLKDMTSKSSD